MLSAILRAGLMGVVGTSAIFIGGHALASAPICTYYPPEQWKSMQEISSMADGLQLERFYVQPEAGCWAIYTWKEGQEWRILLDPKTGEKIREGSIN